MFWVDQPGASALPFLFLVTFEAHILTWLYYNAVGTGFSTVDSDGYGTPVWAPKVSSSISHAAENPVKDENQVASDFVRVLQASFPAHSIILPHLVDRVSQ